MIEQARFSLQMADGRSPAGRRGVLAALAEWWRARRDAHYLLGQPEAMLKDIGLSRSEIEAAVRGRIRR